MYDVFISYRREGGAAMARLLYEHLKDVGLNPFLDLEELQTGLFNVELYKSIEESENFILILPPDSLDRCVNQNDWLRLEIEHALSKNKNIIPLMMSGFSWPSQLPSSLANLPSYNGVQMNPAYFDAAIQKLLSMLSGVTVNADMKKVKSKKEEKRTENKYFYNDDRKEVKRLKIQQKLLKDFDNEVYQTAISKFESLRVLDIGSNNGCFIMDRLGRDKKIEKLIGLEYDKSAVKEANQKYAKENKIVFYETDIESENLEDYLDEILETNDIENFNVINISMVLMHLKSPYRLLKIIRRYLEKGGLIIIKDIDDGLNLAYPDNDGSFARIIDICNKNETSGFRHSGRQIYTLLKRSGYKDIRLCKQGLSVVGMDCDERFAMFDTYFSFIFEDLKIMHQRYPKDKRVAQDLEWYSNKYEEIEELFQDENFFFTLGFMLFTATR